MKKLFLYLVIFLVIMNSFASLVSGNKENKQVIEQDDFSLSEKVVGALDWLIQNAELTDKGYKWSNVENGDEYDTDLYSGVPGICLFFSKAYDLSGNETYLDYAVGGIDWIISKAVEENGYKWPATEDASYYLTGLYSGAAGIGSSFVDYYIILKNESYLEYAKGVSQWLVSIAELEHDPDVGITCKWPYAQGTIDYSFDIIGGAAGIGLFMLKIYNLTNNETYIRYAEYAGNWLIKEAKKIGNCYTWNSKPLNLKFFITPGFAHGTSSIGYFLAELYKYSKDNKYLDYAEGAGRWTIRQSVFDLSSRGLKWRMVLRSDNIPSVFLFDTGWCYGPPGVCEFLIDLYEITKDAKYLRCSELSANWLINLAMSEGDGYKWPRFLHRWGKGSGDSADTTICHGAAGIGEFFLKMYNITEKSIYREYAIGAADWLKYAAVKDDNEGYKWETYGEYHTGHHTGASGIALFLIKADSI